MLASMPNQHPHPRTERDLRWLAESFSAQRIVRGIPERLECLAAWHRLCQEAEKAQCGETNAYVVAEAAYATAVKRLHAVGVGPSDGENVNSPSCGPDA
jgi:hypothetical protein